MVGSLGRFLPYLHHIGKAGALTGGERGLGRSVKRRKGSECRWVYMGLGVIFSIIGWEDRGDGDYLRYLW